MTLPDQDTGMVDGLGETELVDTGLETALQEVLNTKGKDVIELHARLVEHTDTDQTANQGITFEQTFRVFLVEGKQFTIRRQFPKSLLQPNSMRFSTLWSTTFNPRGSIPSSTTDLGQGKLDTPHLTLVAQAVLADNLQFRVTIEE